MTDKPPTRPIPEHLIATLERALDHHNRGRLDEAAALYGQVLQEDPTNGFANHLLGVLHLGAGDAEGAVELIGRAAASEPANGEILKNLASALMASGRLEEAEARFRLALRLKPDYPEALINLASLLNRLGRFGEAEELAGKALGQTPSNPLAHVIHASALDGLGRSEEAINGFRRALELAPEFPDALLNLGGALARKGETEEAERCFRRLIALKPGDPGALNNLGNLLMVEDRCGEAEECYRAALKAEPDNPEVHNNLGSALHFLDRIEEAEACFRRAIELRPDYVRAIKNLANARMSAGYTEQAIEIYDRAIRLAPDQKGLRISRALALPIIPASNEAIEDYRSLMVRNLDALIQSGTQTGEPDKDAGNTGFYLAYHNKNDVACVSKISEMYRRVCPSLSWRPERLPGSGEEGRYRIGFLSFHFYDHTIGKLYRGILENLDRRRFHVTVFRTSRRSDKTARAIEACADEVVYLLSGLDDARRTVADQHLDLLFYPDVGMDAFTYYLSYARLAPVQVTSWGHPMTTGIPNMDYFISSENLETADGQDHYTETLVRLKHPPTYYYRPETPDNADTRASHGLSEDENIYLCPQTLFKFHPNFDPVLGEILRQDPKGRLVLLAGRYKSEEMLLLERFSKSFADVLDRVVFLPRMPMAKFLNLIRLADVVLDPVYFGGGNSSAETIAMGVPIVTWPDVFLRDRVTHAFYQTMGLEDLTAAGAEEYVSLANRLANDTAFRREMSEKIEARSHRLFENMQVVRELEAFMAAAIEAERDGSGPVNWGG